MMCLREHGAYRDIKLQYERQYNANPKDIEAGAQYFMSMVRLCTTRAQCTSKSMSMGPIPGIPIIIGIGIPGGGYIMPILTAPKKQIIDKLFT